MNFLTYEYFLAIYTARSVSRAAETLHISQQSLSQQLSRLEGELGLRLFERTKPLTPTAAGTILAEGARRLLLEQEALMRQLSAQRCPPALRLGFLLDSPPPFLDALLGRFKEECPDTAVSVSSIISASERTLAEYDLIFGVTAADIPAVPGMTGRRFQTDEMAAVVHDGLMRRIWGDGWEEGAQRFRRTGALSCLRDFPFLLEKENLYEQGIQPDADYFADAGFEPRLAAYSGSIQFMQAMCALGEGVMLMPRRYAESLWGGTASMNIFPISHPARQWTQYILVRDIPLQSEALKRLSALFRDYIRDIERK